MLKVIILSFIYFMSASAWAVYQCPIIVMDQGERSQVEDMNMRLSINSCEPEPPSYNGMSLATFSRLAQNSDITGRCTGPISATECKVELDYALDNRLITASAYSWGLANGYYPVIDRNNNIGVICKCGCFESTTNISVFSAAAGAHIEMAASEVNKSHQLVALSSTSSLSSLLVEDFPIKAIAKGKEQLPLYVFELADGTQLKVTQHHGMLLSTGEMVAAKDVTETDSFISAMTQEPVEIVNIGREETFNEVYNFETNGIDDVNHIIVAEGVYVGDLAWQNQLASELGQINLRQ
ncbi:Hint domain-containing protein [uncultured Shewanella sp.]|uniref:Hint domain-containing protein n=1 Tax=uncultured Shewanella sp. TaxID=173975 RepID=UPI00262E5907|nr:Hint domain-containing protein [uncultured Shewanella sp.]